MWQLAQAVQPSFSARILKQLKEAGWFPVNEDEKAGYEELVRLAEKWEYPYWKESPWRKRMTKNIRSRIKLWLYADVNLVEEATLEDFTCAQEYLRKGEKEYEFIVALMRWRRRFDIQVEDASPRIEVGEFDIEIEG